MLIVDLPKADNCAECELVRTCAKRNGVGVTEFIRAKEDGYFTWFCIIKGELVRCGECKHSKIKHQWNAEMYNECELTRRRVEDDWFCADGERKDGKE